jgi:ribosome-associated protein
MVHSGGMTEDLRVNSWLVIPDAELNERFSRSSGPGGQSVNTADSRVELSFDVANSPVLPGWARDRVIDRLGDRLVRGRLMVTASEHRGQLANRQAARARLASLLRDGVAPPHHPRVPTWPSRGERERRLADKRHRSELKRTRRFDSKDLVAGSRVSEIELMHQRWSVGTSKPSPVNT